MKPNAVLLGAAVVATAAWYVAFALLSFLTRPRDVVAGAATTELADEPPGVVNLLVDDFRLGAEVAPAVLLDLAARGFVSIDLVAGAHEVVRVRRGAAREGLTPYERQMLEHVERVSVHGVVPARALTTGPAQVSRWWWRRFLEGIVADAQARGLSRDRWENRHVWGLWGGGLLAALLYAGALRFELGTIFTSLPAAGMLPVVAGMIVILLTLTVSLAQRDTPAGRDAAGRWLGVRAGLSENRVLRDLPPSAVATYGRHLAYAAAMGLAPAAVNGLPLGAEDARRAWSSEGGRWRLVRIRYPRFRPGYGRVPLLVLALGVATAVLSGLAVATIVVPMGGSEGIAEDGWTRFFQVVFLVVLVPAFAIGVAMAVLAAFDIGRYTRVEGVVLRLRTRARITFSKRAPKTRWMVAVDDGSRPKIAAWTISEAQYDLLSQGDRVVVEVTPVLGHVRSIVPSYGDLPSFER